MAHYIIADYASHSDAWQYVSQIGDTPNDTFYNILPYNYKGDDAALPIKFAKRGDAHRVLDPLRVREAEYWQSARIYGHQMPKWKIYKIET